MLRLEHTPPRRGRSARVRRGLARPPRSARGASRRVTSRPGTGSSRSCGRVTRRSPLGPEDGAPRPGEEARLDEQRQRIGLDDRLAVEPLDGEPLRAARTDVGDERVQRGPQPGLLGIPEWDERAAPALHVERGLAVQQHDPRTDDPGGASAGAPRPRQRSAVRLRWIRRCEDEDVGLVCPRGPPPAARAAARPPPVERTARRRAPRRSSPRRAMPSVSSVRSSPYTAPYPPRMPSPRTPSRVTIP